MAKLKSSYELAMERIIRSTYKPRREEDLYDDPLSGIPEFVECWKHPDGPAEHQSLMLEDDETQSYIDDYDSLRGIRPTPESLEIEAKIKEDEIKVIDPIKITYGGHDDPELHWYGHFTGYTGFSRMNRAFAFGLANRGIKVKLDVQESERQVNTTTLRQIDVMEKSPIKDNAPKIFGATIPLNMFHSGKKILYTMMETSETLHDNYVGRLNLFDEIWVPTHFSEKLFKANGVHPPIHVMPLGVDVNRYTTSRKEYNFNQELNSFVFLSVFKWGHRKGYDILIRSFLETFSSQDDVTLLIVSRAEHSNDEEQISKDFSTIRSMVNKKDADLPHIALYDKKIPEKDMPKIYGAADAFALISRGEGFGLPYCFLKGTQINTSEGLKSIENIDVGDSVVTHTGDSKLVNELHKNVINSSFGKIETMLGGEIKGTANHAFWHVKKPSKKEYKNKGVALCGFLDDVKPQWTRMNDIKKGDYLLRPIRKDWNTKMLTVDVRDYCKNENLIEEDGKICSKFSNGPITNQKIADLAGVSKRQVGHYKQDGRLSTRASRDIALVMEKIDIGVQSLM